MISPFAVEEYKLYIMQTKRLLKTTDYQVHFTRNNGIIPGKTEIMSEISGIDGRTFIFVVEYIFPIGM